MRIDIWSDVRCPFCYIGKHKFERALSRFNNKNEINVQWHSFELDPTLKTQPDMNDLEHLSKVKGMPKEQVKQMLGTASEMGKEIGLNLNFEKTTVANSFNAHRLIQLAKTKNLAGEIEEALFKAHFENGQNIDDKPTLKKIGASIGLEEADMDRTLFTDEFADKVEEDKRTAAQIGVRGVPFFVFNQKYAVSGAQPEEAFLEVLEKSWQEFKEESKPLIFNEDQGQSCDIDGNCD